MEAKGEALCTRATPSWIADAGHPPKARMPQAPGPLAGRTGHQPTTDAGLGAAASSLLGDTGRQREGAANNGNARGAPWALSCSGQAPRRGVTESSPNSVPVP